MVFVLRSGIPWQMLPQELECGSGMTCWRRLRDWQRAGVWDLIHFARLDWLARSDQIDWAWAVLDRCSIRAVYGGDQTGPNPTDRVNGQDVEDHMSGCPRSPAPIARSPSFPTPVPVVEGIRVEPGGAVQVSVGDDGTLVYIPGGASTGLRLVWVDRTGQEEVIDAPPKQFRYPRLSPEGTRVAVQDVGDEKDVWVWQFARKTLTRLTFDAAADGYPTWTPDGRYILFSSSRDKVNAPFW